MPISIELNDKPKTLIVGPATPHHNTVTVTLRGEAVTVSSGNITEEFTLQEQRQVKVKHWQPERLNILRLKNNKTTQAKKYKIFTEAPFLPEEEYLKKDNEKNALHRIWRAAQTLHLLRAKMDGRVQADIQRNTLGAARVLRDKIRNRNARNEFSGAIEHIEKDEHRSGIKHICNTLRILNEAGEEPPQLNA